MSNFMMNNRDKYDFILWDLGSYEDSIDFEEYIRMDRKLVLAHGIDWKIKEIDEFYEYTRELDVNRSWNYCIPFIDNKYLRDVKMVVDNPICNIPFCMNPFKPNKNVIEFIEDYVLKSS